MNKKAVVVFSGGVDSSLCLYLALETWGAKNVLAVSFDYGQSNIEELNAAKFIAKTWGVDHRILSVRDIVAQISSCALNNSSIDLDGKTQGRLNVILPGRNALFIRMASMLGKTIGSQITYTGINETDNPDFPDCSRLYMDKLQAVLQMDLELPNFTIATPLVYLLKNQIFNIAHEKGILNFLLQHAITCYRGIPLEGCMKCPSCKVKIDGLRTLQAKKHLTDLPYKFVS